jgi:hypothetical protein
MDRVKDAIAIACTLAMMTRMPEEQVEASGAQGVLDEVFKFGMQKLFKNRL